MRTESTVVDEDDGGSPPSGLQVLVMSLDSFGSCPLPEDGELSIGRASKCDLQIEDRMASRNHAVLRSRAGAITLEDFNSANGTRVRGELVPPGIPVPVKPGDAIAIGATVILVQPAHGALGPRRLWSHAFFENRVEVECGRSGDPPQPFALVRVRLADPVPWVRILPILAQQIGPQNVFAAYGPKDYEVLVLNAEGGAFDALLGGLRTALAPVAGEISLGVARFPRDGRNVDALLETANAQLRGEQKMPPPSPVAPGPIARSPALAQVYAMADRAAASNISALILGETGSGKDVMARYIHARSPRAQKPFVAINCAGLAESLIESELFGHERGAFTGAIGPKPGLIESAHEGTLFLDEIGDMPVALQARLLRVIESREVMRVGAVRTRSVDVRFLAATNHNLEAACDGGRFRRDLYFRLNGITLSIPPLRERTGEIEGLARMFLATAAAETGRPAPSLSGDALELLVQHGWPGNVRELKNIMERAFLLCDGNQILPVHLPVDKMRPHKGASMASVADPIPAGTLQGESAARSSSFKLSGNETQAEERIAIMEALAACAGSQTRAAEALGVSRRTLISKIEKHGLPRPQKGARVTPPERGVALDAATPDSDDDPSP